MGMLSQWRAFSRARISTHQHGYFPEICPHFFPFLIQLSLLLLLSSPGSTFLRNYWHTPSFVCFWENQQLQEGVLGRIPEWSFEDNSPAKKTKTLLADR